MKRSKRKLARRPYWARALRNLLAAAALFVIVWDVMDMALPGQLEFRRLERQALAPPSEIIAVIPTRDPFLPHILIGLTEEWAMVGTPYSISSELSDSNIFPLNEGANLICLRQSVGIPDWAGQVLFYAAYAAVRPPEDSASAVLTLHNADGDFRAESIRDGAVFLFYFRVDEIFVQNRLRSPTEYTYELEFYDENGAFIQRISG